MYGTATQSLSVSEPNGPLDLDPISSSSGPCILYTEIPYLSRFLRIVGHIAVTNSDRTKIYELRAWPLLGTNNSVWVLEGRGDVVSPILFGRPRKMLPVALPPGADAAWDDALEEEAVRWRTRRHLVSLLSSHVFISSEQLSHHTSPPPTGHRLQLSLLRLRRAQQPAPASGRRGRATLVPVAGAGGPPAGSAPPPRDRTLDLAMERPAEIVVS